MSGFGYSIVCFSLSCLSALVPTVVWSQASDPVAAQMGLTRETGSLPVWERPAPEAKKSLVGVVRDVQSGIFLVGNAEITGTAFVISKKHRLLATNAHVADIMDETGSMLAIQNDSTNVFNVEKIWYHPGVRRFVRGASIRSQNPADGDVDTSSPDVAVLQLAEGADLPYEFEMASMDELHELFAQPVAMLGYPSHDTSWPAVGERPTSTLRDGKVSRVSNFFNRGDAPDAELQQLQHSMMSYGGFSGSPIFLSNGHVVALHNAARPLDGGARIQFGVRIDCLWELILYHGLDQQVATGTNRDDLLIGRYLKPDPEEDRFREAIALEVEAKRLVANQKYAEAVEKCNEAINLAPGFADAYYARGNAYNDYAQNGTGNVDKLKYMQLAMEDSRKYTQLNPSDMEGLIEHCVTVCNLTNEETGSQRNRLASDLLTKLLDSGQLNDDLKSRAHRTRAQANGWDESTLFDLNMAIQLQPFEENNYLARSYYWNDRGDAQSAGADRQAYDRLSEAYRLRWERSSEKDVSKKIAMAKRACELTEWGYWSDIQYLALVTWSSGDIEGAMVLQNKAVAIAPEAEKRTAMKYLRQMLEEFGEK